MRGGDSAVLHVGPFLAGLGGGAGRSAETGEGLAAESDGTVPVTEKIGPAIAPGRTTMFVFRVPDRGTEMGIADPQDPGVSQIWKGDGLTRPLEEAGAETGTGLSISG